MSGNKYESNSWKVKMSKFLEATNHEYLGRIYDGPFILSKIAPATPDVSEHYIRKEKSK